nr:hypothetical protein [Tanacetum cinerariifolium]
MANSPLDHNEFALAAEATPDNMSGCIEEEDLKMKEEEDSEMEEEEKEEEMEIDDEMDDPEVIHLYEIEEGELSPPPTESDISTDTEPEVEAEVEDETEAATIGSIPRAPYHVHPFSSNSYMESGSSRHVLAPGPMGKDVDTLHLKVKRLAQQRSERANTEYSTLKRLSKMDRYLGELDTDLRSKTQGHCELKQSVSTLEDQVRGLMLEDREEKERLKKKLKRVNAALEEERARQVNARGQGGASAVREYTFAGFMKCNPTVFHGQEGAVELCRWFKKTEMVFEISECAEKKKVKFFAATLQDRALTWWNSQVATRGLEAANRITWTEMKKLMIEEFCLAEEIQRMEHELSNLKIKDFNMPAYTQRFHELALLCPEMVLTEHKKIDAYIRGLTDNIKGAVISSKPASLNEAVRMAYALMEQKAQARTERIAIGK